MTKPGRADGSKVTHYPHLHPAQPLELVQIDIVPHYLPGGRCVSCFHAIDVVLHYPTGWQSLTKRSGDAGQFLIRAWRELWIPDFTQVDNEGCFSGGSTHPPVLGKVVRLALLVGTQLVFSPFYHLESNGTVERFHQEYSKHVWKKIELPDFSAVAQSSPGFFERYRHSGHHSALQGHCPADLHPKSPAHPLPTDFHPPAKLRIYDAPPDAHPRACLAEHSFPLKEQVRPLAPVFQRLDPPAKHSRWRPIVSLAARWISTM